MYTFLATSLEYAGYLYARSRQNVLSEFVCLMLSDDPGMTDRETRVPVCILCSVPRPGQIAPPLENGELIHQAREPGDEKIYLDCETGTRGLTCHTETRGELLIDSFNVK